MSISSVAIGGGEDLVGASGEKPSLSLFHPFVERDGAAVGGAHTA
jgi:hypothetical protein